MTPDRQFEYLKRTILDKITTWDDMYTMYDELVSRAKDHPSVITFSNALFLMYAFFFAMRETPEEGDIKKLMERALRILVYEGGSKLGISFEVVSAEDFYSAVGRQVVEATPDVVLAQMQAEKPKGPLH
jgi:hypothetical protein